MQRNIYSKKLLPPILIQTLLMLMLAAFLTTVIIVILTLLMEQGGEEEEIEEELLQKLRIIINNSGRKTYHTKFKHYRQCHQRPPTIKTMTIMIQSSPENVHVDPNTDQVPNTDQGYTAQSKMVRIAAASPTLPTNLSSATRRPSTKHSFPARGPWHYYGFWPS